MEIYHADQEIQLEPTHEDDDLKPPILQHIGLPSPELIFNVEQQSLSEQCQILKLKASANLQASQYKTQSMKMKFNLVQHIVNVGNPSIDKFPIQMHYKISKNMNKIRSIFGKMEAQGFNQERIDNVVLKKQVSSQTEKEGGVQNKDISEQLIEAEQKQSAWIQYNSEVCLELSRPQTLESETRKFEYLVENLHRAVMKGVSKMQISIGLNKTTKKLLGRIKKIMEQCPN